MILKVYDRDGNYHATIVRASTVAEIRTAAARHIRAIRKLAREHGTNWPIFTRVSGYWWVNGFSGQYIRVLADSVVR